MSIEPESLPLGTVIASKYRLDRILGRGGFGVVFAATTASGGSAAVKVLAQRVLDQAGGIGRFQREAELASRLSHENIVRVLDAGADEHGLLYIAFELLDGRSVEAALAETGPMSPRRAAEIGIDVLAALEEAHGLGVIHRDIKPANLYLVRDPTGARAERVKVLDFGIAKSTNPNTRAGLTRDGTTMGTPVFMAPEQVLGQTVGPPTDLFALGIVLAEMILGASPYGPEQSGLEIVTQRITGKPVPLPGDLIASPIGPVLLRATAGELRDRYASASQMRQDLVQALPFLSSEARARLGGESALAAAPTEAAPERASNGRGIAPPRGSWDSSDASPKAASVAMTSSSIGGAPTAMAERVPATLPPATIGAVHGATPGHGAPMAGAGSWVQRPLPSFPGYGLAPVAPVAPARPASRGGMVVFAILAVGALVTLVGVGAALYIAGARSTSTSKKTTSHDAPKDEDTRAAPTAATASVPAVEPTLRVPRPKSALVHQRACPRVDSLSLADLVANVAAVGLHVEGTSTVCLGDEVNGKCVGGGSEIVTTTTADGDAVVTLMSLGSKVNVDAYVAAETEDPDEEETLLIGQQKVVSTCLKAPAIDRLAARICR